jgi:hypothetical protein
MLRTSDFHALTRSSYLAIGPKKRDSRMAYPLCHWANDSNSWPLQETNALSKFEASIKEHTQTLLSIQFPIYCLKP